MGAHRKHRVTPIQQDLFVPSEWPPLPDNVGKLRKLKAIDGKILHFKIEDEIIHKQSTSNRKIIVFQKIKFVADSRIEFRFGYYMIGMKPKARGRWVWGQFCLLIPQEDLSALIEEANRRKWFQRVAAPNRQKTAPDFR